MGGSLSGGPFEERHYAKIVAIFFMHDALRLKICFFAFFFWGFCGRSVGVMGGLLSRGSEGRIVSRTCGQ